MPAKAVLLGIAQELLLRPQRRPAGCTSGCKVFSASCRLVLFKLTGLDLRRKCSSALHIVKSYKRERGEHYFTHLRRRVLWNWEVLRYGWRSCLFITVITCRLLYAKVIPNMFASKEAAAPKSALSPGGLQLKERDRIYRPVDKKASVWSD